MESYTNDILGSVFLDVAVIQHDQTILHAQCVFP